MSRSFFFLFLIFFFYRSNGQTTGNDLIQYNSKEFKISKKEGQDPKLLVAALTKGKSGDKEKFDALFGWVVANIRYNYRQYYSSYGSFALPTKYILRTRRVVCLGYANLMDTLCSIAGITNTTVYGFAKDNLFDVHDSVYVDNHAWNAVKLDGLWYLYDITWSTGKEEYMLRPFSMFIYKLWNKLPKQYKEVKIRRKREFRRECKDESGPAFYIKQKKMNSFLRGFLQRFKMRVKKTYHFNINSDYYLSQPEIFAITHFPNDTIWTLGGTRNLTAFENDSAYYYLNDSVLGTQIRDGRECAACDSFLALDFKEKRKAAEKGGERSNVKNNFVITENEYVLGEINYKEALRIESDSIKLLFLDSAAKNYHTAKDALQKAKVNASVEAKLQMKKNKVKLNLLLSENRTHRRALRKKMKLSLNQLRIYRQMSNKTAANADRWRRKAGYISRINTSFKVYPPKLSERRVSKTIYKLNMAHRQLDSLYLLITEKRTQYDSLVGHVSLNVWPQARILDTISDLLRTRIRMRHKLLDNYKKPVEDIRKKIDKKEYNFNYDLGYLVYTPASRATVLYNQICNLIRKKQHIQQKCLGLERDLVKVKENPMSVLISYKEFVLSDIKSDYCWLANNWPREVSMHRGFAILWMQQHDIDGLLPFENDAERDRHAIINRETKRRYRKYNNIISNNKSLVNAQSRKALRYSKAVRKRKK